MKKPIIVDENELKYLLEKKRDYIGKKTVGGELILSSVFFILSLIGATFEDFFSVSGIVVKTICICVGFICFIYGVAQMINSCRKQCYNQEILLEDIKKLSVPASRHSLVAIKDTFNAFSNRFLLYYDEVWDCRFFFNYSTKNIESDNNENIRSKLSNRLKIDKDKIGLKYIDEEIQVKYSPKIKSLKTYEHKVYVANILDFSEIMKKSKFEVDGIKYIWMTIDEMKNDKKILQRNLEVVELIDRMIP